MNEDAMDTFVFAILKKREAMKIKKRTRDLVLYETESISSHSWCIKLLHTGGISRVDDMPNSLCVLTEADELIDTFLTPAVLTTLNNNEHMIEKIHFSDQVCSHWSFLLILSTGNCNFKIVSGVWM